MKKVCKRKKFPVRFQTDPRKLTTEDLLSAIEKWLKNHAAENPMAKPIQDVKLYRNVVLNPYSHSAPVNLAAAEVDGAIKAVDALHQAFGVNMK